MRKSILFASIFLLALPVAAETIVLKSGMTVEGKIVERVKDKVRVDLQGTSTTYYFDEIDTIDGEKPPLPGVLQEVKKEEWPAPVEPVMIEAADALPKNEMTEEDKLIDQVLELNGTKDWLNRLPERNEKNIYETPAAVKGDIEGFRKLRAETYGADSINRYFYQSLKKYYDETRFKVFRDFLITPLARKITEREKASEQLSEQELKAEYEVFAKEILAERRDALISGLILSTKSFHLQLALAGYVRVMSFKTYFHMTEEQLQDEIAHLIDELGGGADGAISIMFAQEGFYCRHFSDQELEEYIQNMSSPDIEYVQEAIYQSVIETFAKMREDYVSGFKERFPDSAGDSARAENGEEKTIATLSQKQEQVPVLMEQAHEYQRQGDMKRAQQTSEKVISLMEQMLFLDPDNAGFCLSLGVSYQMAHYRIGRAAVLSEKAIALGTPELQVGAYHTLGLIYSEWGKLDRAEELFNKAIALATDAVWKAQSYNALGILYREQGQLDRAVEALEQAIKFNPEDSNSYGLLGLIAAQQGKIEMAEKYLKKAEQLGLDAAHVEQVKSMIRTSNL